MPNGFREIEHTLWLLISFSRISIYSYLFGIPGSGFGFLDLASWTWESYGGEGGGGGGKRLLMRVGQRARTKVELDDVFRSSGRGLFCCLGCETAFCPIAAAGDTGAESGDTD